MAQPFGREYSQNLNWGSSDSSNMQGSNLVQKIGKTIKQAAQSQLNLHSNSIPSSNVRNSEVISESQSAKTGASASAGSFATSSAHGAQSHLVSHSNSFSGLNVQNTNFANTRTNAATGSFTSSSTHGAQSQLASLSNSLSGSTLNQGDMSTGSQFANLMTTAATQVHGGRIKYLQDTL